MSHKCFRVLKDFSIMLSGGAPRVEAFKKDEIIKCENHFMDSVRPGQILELDSDTPFDREIKSWPQGMKL